MNEKKILTILNKNNQINNIHYSDNNKKNKITFYIGLNCPSDPDIVEVNLLDKLNVDLEKEGYIAEVTEYLGDYDINLEITKIITQDIKKEKENEVHSNNVRQIENKDFQFNSYGEVQIDTTTKKQMINEVEPLLIKLGYKRKEHYSYDTNFGRFIINKDKSYISDSMSSNMSNFKSTLITITDIKKSVMAFNKLNLKKKKKHLKP